MKIKKSLQIDRNLHQKLRLFCAINDVTISAISSMRDEGQSIRKIAKELNLGVGTVHKACSEMVVQNNEVATA